jgi:MFS family permease
MAPRRATPACETRRAVLEDAPRTPPPASALSRPRISATRFVVLFGIVSSLGDIVYEGARSVLGPYLGSLGAGAAAIGLITGAGEATALGLRLVSGPLADRTRAYWPIAIAGYACTLVAVPLLALGGGLAFAIVLVLAERFGKALRSPARDTMLADAGGSAGRGKAFALHEALDQTGAVIGPVLVAVCVTAGGYALGFGILAIPSAIALAVLLRLRAAVPHPEVYEHDRVAAGGAAEQAHGPLPAAFWRYTAFSAVVMLGFATFPVLGFHLSHAGVLSAGTVPLVYAGAMATDAGAALLAGRAYDRRGLGSLVVLPPLVAVVPWLAFSTSAVVAVLGALVWGVALGIQESTMRAAVADLAPRARRGTAYGIFTVAYGVAWLGGSVLVGALYAVSTTAAAVAVTGVEVVALVVFAVAVRRGR